MLRSALLILSGKAFASLLLLARNLIVARLIPIEDYGIAATFAISMSVVEMLSDLGLQRQIVQDRNGNDPHLQAGLQGFQALRGVISCGLLYLLAGPIAAFMGVPQVTWAYQVMALVPLLNGLVHFDMFRMNRTMVYGPAILTGVVPALAAVLILWPLKSWFGDYQVMLYSVLIQAALTTLMSHLVARRRYGMVLDRAIMQSSLRFGWPLLVNGILLFAVFNGERLIVGRELGMAPLALFSMGVTLTLTPTLVMASAAQAFFLPQLAAVQGVADRARFAHLAMATFQCHLLFGIALVLGVMLAGRPVVHLLLGAKYDGVLPLIIWMAIMQGIRVFKGGASSVALARGQTENAMVANLVRVALLPLAWVVAARSGDMVLVLWLGILGETVGYVVSLWLARWRLSLSLRALSGPIALTVLLLVVAGAQALALQSPTLAAGWIPAGLQGLATLLFVLTLASMGDLRRYGAARTLTRRVE